MRSVLLFGLLLFLGALFYAGKNKINGNVTAEIVPPNCIKVDENLFVDRTEITNFHWLEYLYWTKRIYGKKSEEYIAALPDTNVWSALDSTYISLDTNYLRHPAYRDYPLVGISHQQAIDFGKWREERVMEYLLIANNFIDRNRSNNIDSVFSVEKLLSGNYPVKRSIDELQYRVRFRLPSEAEWQKAFQQSKTDFDILTTKYQNRKKKIAQLAQARTNIDQTIGRFSKIPPLNAMTKGALDKKNYFIYLRGNVSEWLIEKNNYIGTNFMTKLDQEQPTSEKLEAASSVFVGARFIAYWEAI